MNRLLFILLAVLLFSSAAPAQTNCNIKRPTPLIFANAGQQALRVEATLDRLKPKVALLARIGIDLSKYNLRYSHIAFLIHNDETHHWDTIHLLSQCKIPTSAIYRQGLMNFYVDDLITLDSRLIIPDAHLQQQLLALLNSNTKLALHDDKYSVIAYPYAMAYQNSNQWVLEVLAAASSGASNRTAAQVYLRSHHYNPAVVTFTPSQKIGALLFKKNIKFDDHPANELHRYSFSFVSVNRS